LILELAATTIGNNVDELFQISWNQCKTGYYGFAFTTIVAAAAAV